MIKAFEHAAVFGAQSEERPVEVEVGRNDLDEFIRVAERAGLEIVQSRSRLNATAPMLVTAVVLGALFALIGLQGLNVALGFPRMEAVLSIPANLIGAIFTIVGLVCGCAVGSVISMEPSRAERERLTIFGDKGVTQAIGRQFGVVVR